MAQVAHVVLKAKGSSEIGQLQDLIDGRKIVIRTVAFAAPMSLALAKGEQQDSEGAQFLYGTIAPNMVNIVFKDDVFPRIYSDIPFIKNVYHAVTGSDAVAGSVLKNKKDELNELLKMLLDMIRDTAESYRHFGKIIYYESADAIPTIHRDQGFHGTGWPKLHSNETNFCDVKRTTRSDDALAGDLMSALAGDPMSDHMALISPGLAFSV